VKISKDIKRRIQFIIVTPTYILNAHFFNLSINTANIISKIADNSKIPASILNIINSSAVEKITINDKTIKITLVRIDKLMKTIKGLLLRYTDGFTFWSSFPQV
jgi:hypothetical protein